MLEIIDRTIAECMAELRALQAWPIVKRIEVDSDTVLEIDEKYQATLTRCKRVYWPQANNVVSWAFIADDSIFREDFRQHTRAYPTKPFYGSVWACDTADGGIMLVFTVYENELNSGGSYSKVQKQKQRAVIFYADIKGNRTF